MPIEIRELIIKATINENNNRSGRQPTPSNATSLDDKLVQKIADQVLKKINNKNER